MSYMKRSIFKLVKNYKIEFDLSKNKNKKLKKYNFKRKYFKNK